MSQQPSQALVKRPSSDVSLMPPPPLKRIKRPTTVLDEDEYTAALSEIIARDYFPGLLESQAQHEYLAALESDNEAWIAEAAKKLREAAMPASSKRRTARNTRFDTTPSATPMRNTPSNAAETPLGYNGSDTPMTTTSEASAFDVNHQPNKSVDTSTLTLGNFQAKYTSEDNESFNAVLDKQNQKRREKHVHLWTQDQRIPSARQIAHRAREARLLTEQEEAKASGKSLIPITSGATDSRPAKPDSWTIKRPDNPFMFHAESVDETGLPTIMESKEQKSKAAPRQVVHANTRFPSAAMYRDDPGPIPPSPSPSLNTDIIARRDAERRGQRGLRGGGDDSSTMVGPTDSDASYYTGSETPRVNGYAFVDEDEPDANPPQKPDNTPSYRDLLAGQTADATPNPFRINEIRKREDLHLRMVEKQARGKREKEKDRTTIQATPTPGSWTSTPGSSFMSLSRKSTSGGGGNMTPAARRLMEKLGGRTPVNSSSTATTKSGERSLAGKDMWTPGRTPRRDKTKKGKGIASGVL
ncbi:hypothetical protein PV10_05810 [Exophiala mesophila]|uniref:Nuclear protein DGCR14 n=1 Tax=Exophiala mesophila TaxID=212818 RepID=A0A0D1WQ98_EXOME|nr:uncharacterized protein PV10_05810 [Exophiala mesophila]KIV91250.1 hypothetical protein PV10_05810 [Exophiala mesophila]